MRLRVKDDWKDLLKLFGDELVTCVRQCHKTVTAGQQNLYITLHPLLFRLDCM